MSVVICNRVRRRAALATVLPSPSDQHVMLERLSNLAGLPSTRLMSFVVMPLVLGAMMLLNGFQEYRRVNGRRRRAVNSA
mmetsp:Transcript_3913/g.16737  ORF Transcript_3913/g.16737 Transcript_3913/m.16737 type:complete len:80 (-) Transcript_3913:1618-1857(-)